MFNSVNVGACSYDGLNVVLRHVGSVWCRCGGLETTFLILSNCGNGSETLMVLMGH